MGVSKVKLVLLFAVTTAFFLTAAACRRPTVLDELTNANGSEMGKKPSGDTEVVYVLTKVEVYDTSGSCYKRIKYSYDEKGNLIEEITEFCYSDPVSVFIERYSYDDYGNLLKATDEDGNLNYSFEYTYDDAGNILTQTPIGSNSLSRSEYSYDSMGKMTSERTYYSNGSPLSCSTYDKNGKMLTCESYNEDGTVQSRTEYAYDEHGNSIIESRESNGTVEKLEFKIEYNEWGKYTSVTTFYNGCADLNIEYRYDERGYLTNLSTSDSNGEYSGGVEFTRDKNGNATQTVTSYHDYGYPSGIGQRKTVYNYQAIAVPSYLAEKTREKQEHLVSKYAGGI